MKKIKKVIGLGVLILSAAAPVTVLAHATLEQQKAAVGSSYKAVIKVPHGCGSEPTLRLRVQVPDGMVSVKPMQKPGWQLDVVKKSYDKAYQYRGGASLTEGVREIKWTGKLSNDDYDEFVFVGYLSDTLKPDTVLYFPVIQECEKGSERWIEIPAEGKTSRDYRFPAPGLKLMLPSSN